MGSHAGPACPDGAAPKPRLELLTRASLVLALLVVAVLAGCSGDGPEPPADSASEPPGRGPGGGDQAPGWERPEDATPESVPEGGERGEHPPSSPEDGGSDTDRPVHAQEHEPPGSWPLPPGVAPRPPGPIDEYIAGAAAFLSTTQAEDGSWEYFHSRKADFTEPEPHARLFGTAMVLMNLAHTEYAGSPVHERGARYLRGRMGAKLTWSLYASGRFGPDHEFEPDADDTAVAMVVLAGTIEPSEVQLVELRALFDQQLGRGGLYRTYFDGFHGEKGFVPDPDVPSFGVNLNVLGFFARYGLERGALVAALRAAMTEERYWERSPFYRSLPVLAALASNAVEHGAGEARDLTRALLADVSSENPEPGSLHNLELAALVKARSHMCLLDAEPCRDLDPMVQELASRRKENGSWDPGPLYEYDVNQGALRAFIEGRGFARPRPRGGVAYDADRALAAQGTAHYYDGSAAETTSFALKALVFYRELLTRRPVFANMPREE